MENNKYMELFKNLKDAQDEYLELRDAKSNGCLGWNPPIFKVLEYDKKIEAAAAKVKKADEELTKYINSK